MTTAPQQSRSATGRAISMHSALTDGAVPSGWNTATGTAVGPGTGCNQPTSNVGTVLLGNQGIEVPGSAPIDSTASVDPSNGTLLFDAGNAAEAVDGGYYDYTPGGSEVWNQVVTNPSTDTVPNGGVQASPSLGDAGTLAEAGSLGQVTYGLNTANGAPAPGWPQFDADSNVLDGSVSRPVQHRQQQLHRRRRYLSGLRLRDRLRKRRAGAHLQRPRGPRLCRKHDRGSRLVAGRRPDPGGRWLRDRDRDRKLLGDHQRAASVRRQCRQGVRHEVQPGMEPDVWTATPEAAPPWPTSRAMASWR